MGPWKSFEAKLPKLPGVHAPACPDRIEIGDDHQHSGWYHRREHLPFGDIRPGFDRRHVSQAPAYRRPHHASIDLARQSSDFGA